METYVHEWAGDRFSSASDRREFTAALFMLFQIIGFLESKTHSRNLARQVSQVFEMVDKASGCVFSRKIDTGKIKQSKFFYALLKHLNGQARKELDLLLNSVISLDHVKKWVTEMVIWPLLHPDVDLQEGFFSYLVFSGNQMGNMSPVSQDTVTY